MRTKLIYEKRKQIITQGSPILANFRNRVLATWINQEWLAAEISGKTKKLTCPFLSVAAYSIEPCKKVVIEKTVPHKERTEESFQLLAHTVQFCRPNKAKHSLQSCEIEVNLWLKVFVWRLYWLNYPPYDLFLVFVKFRRKKML